jgi:translation initiation factor 1 (eIF-1/SUI1)
MKKSKRVPSRRPAAKRAWLFACALVVAGVATAAAAYASRNVERPKAPAAAAAAQPADPHVTVEVGGRKLRVNARALQQGPLSPAEAERLAEQLEGNKATEGLVEEKHEDGSVSVDLQGRFQNVVLAKRNDDGTVSAACVDTPEAAGAFLGGGERSPSVTGGGTAAPRKAGSKQ